MIGTGVFVIDASEARPQPGNSSADTRASRIGDNTPVTGANKYIARDKDTGPDRGEIIIRAGDAMSSDNTRMTRSGVCALHAGVCATGPNERLTADNIFAIGSRLSVIRQNTFRYGTNISWMHINFSDTHSNFFDGRHDKIEKASNTRYARGCSRERHARSAECLA